MTRVIERNIDNLMLGKGTLFSWQGRITHIIRQCRCTARRGQEKQEAPRCSVDDAAAAPQGWPKSGTQSMSSRLKPGLFHQLCCRRPRRWVQPHTLFQELRCISPLLVRYRKWRAAQKVRERGALEPRILPVLQRGPPEGQKSACPNRTPRKS